MAATSRRMPRGKMPQRVRTRVLALLDDDLDLPPNCKQAAELVVKKAVAAPTKNQVTTKNLHTPGQAVAFPCEIPHAVLGGHHRKSPRYSLNIFF
jgi:hypothetical protein